jgi:hypothetical protein
MKVMKSTYFTFQNASTSVSAQHVVYLSKYNLPPYNAVLGMLQDSYDGCHHGRCCNVFR